jgi:DNA (cytosine-5)-methyltransferase 1
MKKTYHGIDLFSGAGGMSVGAIRAGVDVKLAVEVDKFAALTFKANHPATNLFNDDIRKFQPIRAKDNSIKILFGGPPCQGFSTSNQKTRNKINPTNWLFKEYLRVVKSLAPDWVIVENVKGIIETEQGYFFNSIIEQLNLLGYATTHSVLNAADYGVPQVRNRVFIVGSLHGIKYKFPKPTHNIHLTVNDAISDLPKLENGAKFYELDYKSQPKNTYQEKMRFRSKKAINNFVTNNTSMVLNRYSHIPQGGNWENIPPDLMSNYKDYTRCHTGIYHRLIEANPSVVIGNYRKNMLVHPTEDRGLSVREAARIQSFPDHFHFYGSIGFQQQQVGNSVPPLLSESLFNQILKY